MKRVKLTKGMYTIVDDVDFNRVVAHSWYAHQSKPGQFYARHDFPGKKRVLLHRFILEIYDPDVQVDHINGNKLDNRRDNLRIADSQQNSRNQSKLKSNNVSGYRGVSFNKKSGKFEAYMRLSNKKRKHLGLFESAEEAAKTFNEAAKAEYGEFCGKLNEV